MPSSNLIRENKIKYNYECYEITYMPRSNIKLISYTMNRVRRFLFF